MMTRKERFLTAVRGGQPDRVPMFDFLFQQPLYEELIGHRPGTYNAADAVALALALEHDAVWLPFGGFNGFQPQFLDANTYIDEWGTTYRHNDSSWPIDAPIDYPIKSRQDLARYRPPDPTLPGRTSQLEAFWQTAPRRPGAHRRRHRPVHHLLDADGLRADLLRAVRRSRDPDRDLPDLQRVQQGGGPPVGRGRLPCPVDLATTWATVAAGSSSSNTSASSTCRTSWN